MDIQKHTPEPWRQYEDKRFGERGNVHYYDWVIDSNARKFMAVLSVPAINADRVWRKNHPAAMKENIATRHEVRANAKRIVACVNGCRGLVDPESEVPKFVSMIEEAHSLLVAVINSLPDSDPACQQARKWLKKSKKLPLWPSVTAAFTADKDRQS